MGQKRFMNVKITGMNNHPTLRPSLPWWVKSKISLIAQESVLQEALQLQKILLIRWFMRIILKDKKEVASLKLSTTQKINGFRASVFLQDFLPLFSSRLYSPAAYAVMRIWKNKIDDNRYDLEDIENDDTILHI